MISDPKANPGGSPPARDDVRLRMKPNTAATGYVDGAWWPRSHSPAAEFPGLVLAMSSWVGPVSRVSYHLGDWERIGRELVVEGWAVTLNGFGSLEANTIMVTGSNRRRRNLLVVPAETPGGVARAVLAAASGSDTVASVSELLLSNGVAPAKPNPLNTGQY